MAQAVGPVAVGRVHLFEVLDIACLAAAPLVDGVEDCLGHIGRVSPMQPVHVLEGLGRRVG